MLSINLPSGPPSGPATTAGASPRAADDSSLPEGFEGLLAGLLTPPAPPPATLPVVDLAGARAVAPPTIGPVEGEDAASGDAAELPDGGRPGPAPRFELPATAPDGASATIPTEGAPAAGMADPPQARAAGGPGRGLVAPSPATAIATKPSADDAPPISPAPVDRAARGENAGAAAVELPAGRPGVERPGLRAVVGPAAARSPARTGNAQVGLMQYPAGQVDDYRAADDSLGWRGLLAVDGPPALAGAPLDAAGAAEAPLAASAVRQLALAIGRAVSGDVRQLSVQLSPEELGGLEITIDFADERRVAVKILAERPETLDLLRGETRQLERLMAQQGVALAAGGFELGLLADGRGQRREHAGTGPGQRSSIELADPADAVTTATAGAPSARHGLLNLSV